MTRESKIQPTPTVVRKLVTGADEVDAIESVIELRDGADRPREEVMEHLVRSFILIREGLKLGDPSCRFPVSKLISAFGEAARRRNIDREKFFALLLERTLGRAEPEEDPAAAAKRSTKERILDAALEVFSEKGFHPATVDEIAERASVGKGTLYRYFANKETLFNELVRLRLEKLEARAAAVLDGHDDVLTMITKYLRIYFEFFDRNKLLYRLILQERSDMGEYVQDLYFKKVMRRIPDLKRKIYEASQQGVLKDVDFQTVFYGVMGFVHGVMQKWLARDCSYPLVDELPGVVEVLFYGFVRDRNSVVDM